ncbi:MAG: hypothetical protein ACIAXF_05520 [Phycisphaerales bacterium JB063]
MTQSERIKIILAGARADLAAIANEPEPPTHRGWEWRPWRDRQDHAAEGVVALRTAAWFGVDRLSHSDTTLNARALDAGARRGLWRRVVSPGGRCWGLELLGGGDAG